MIPKCVHAAPNFVDGPRVRLTIQWGDEVTFHDFQPDDVDRLVADLMRRSRRRRKRKSERAVAFTVDGRTVRLSYWRTIYLIHALLGAAYEVRQTQRTAERCAA